MLFHDRQMYRIASRKAAILENNLFRTLDCFAIYRQDLVHYAQQRIESWLNCVAAIVMLTPIGTNCRVYESKMESL